MKKLFLNPLFTFLLGGILFASIGVVASEILASSIKYKNTNVGSALDELYTISSSYKNLSSVTTVNPNNLLSGETAYNSNGELVTGTIPASIVSTKVLLWENASPNSSMEASDLNLSRSLNNYTHILIQYKVYANSSVVYDDIFKITPNRVNGVANGGYYTIGGSDSNNQTSQRKIAYVNDTKLRAGNAFNTDTNNIMVNDVLIPLYIYGLNLSY